MIESAVELASEADVKRMRVAARGLEPAELQGALAASGIDAPRGLRSVPAASVGLLCRFLEAASRGDARPPVAAYLAAKSSLEHEGALDDWPASGLDTEVSAFPEPTGPVELADAADLKRLREAAEGLVAGQISNALALAGVSARRGVGGVPRHKVHLACSMLRACLRGGDGRVS